MTSTQQVRGSSDVAKRMLDNAVEMIGTPGQLGAVISILRTLSANRSEPYAQAASAQLIIALNGFISSPEAQEVGKRLMAELDPQKPENADRAFFWAQTAASWSVVAIGTGNESQASAAVKQAQRIFERNGDYQNVGLTTILEAAVLFASGSNDKEALRKLELGRHLVTAHTTLIPAEYASSRTTTPMLAGIGSGAQKN